jgi:hypothetical protein
MAVYQTRAFFRREHGYLTDNPAIGPALAANYWAPGNSVDHEATLRSLTGEGFSARYLAETCNRTAVEAWKNAELMIAAATTRDYPATSSRDLNAHIRVVHGTAVLADSSDGEDAMCARFESWVQDHYFAPSN